ncbi:LPS export ABC transporter periplasmic protein LptC [Deltaproteobacteria bacterium Smac51]|nr:LPS export ABC transporter periplasmic protein LptC [Deltaproteobacteria bacterium Smac51]
MQRARFWILCAMGALLVISGALLFGARHWAVSAKALKNILPADVDMRLDNLVLSEAGEEGRTMVINASSAHYYKTDDLFILKDVRAKIVTDTGDYKVEAESGRYEQSEKKITLDGNITVIDNQSGVLTSDSLRFNFGEGRLISDGPFCYSTPKLDLDGKSFVFHTKDKRLEVEGRTYMLFN